MKSTTRGKIFEAKVTRRTTPLKPRGFVNKTVTIVTGCETYEYPNVATFKRRLATPRG